MLETKFYLFSNQLCGWDAIPDEVAELSASMTSGWSVATGNEGIGQPCCETLAGYNCLPVALPTEDTTSVTWANGAYTGTIPTEWGLLTNVGEIR